MFLSTHEHRPTVNHAKPARSLRISHSYTSLSNQLLIVKIQSHWVLFFIVIKSVSLFLGHFSGDARPSASSKAAGPPALGSDMLVTYLISRLSLCSNSVINVWKEPFFLATLFLVCEFVWLNCHIWETLTYIFFYEIWRMSQFQGLIAVLQRSFD